MIISRFQIAAKDVVSKLVFLIDPYLKDIPVGIYEVEHELLHSYIIKGFYHNKERFIKPSSLLLELF